MPARLFTRRTDAAGASTATPPADRGVSPVIGAILMFALALSLLAIIQTAAIPPLNAQYEFHHSERVQGDFLEVSGAVDRAAATGAGGSVGIESSVRYPPRLFFVNPPPVAGRLETTEPATAVVANASAAGEAGDYWNGTPKAFDTRSLEFAADYHEYANAPTPVFEPWAVYTRGGGATTLLTDDGVVDGRRITVTTLDGSVARSSARSVSLGIAPASAPARVVTVRDDGGPLTLTLPTQLTAEDWDSLLGDEVDPAGDPTNDRYVTALDCRRPPPEPCGRLTVTLERNVSYDLRLASVTLGGDGAAPGGTYLVDVAGDETSLPENGTQQLVVEARDRFDNHVSGVAVNASLDGDGTLRSVTPTTGSDGRAVFVYEAPTAVASTTDVRVTASFGGAGPRESVTFTLRVMDVDGAGSGGSAPTVTITNVAASTPGNQDRYDVSADIEDADGDLDRVEFELQDPGTGAVLDDTSVSIGGTSASVTERLSVRGTARLADYRIVVVGFDDGGDTGRDERTVAGSG